MTTTSIHPGHSVSGVLNHPEWGEGYSAHERKRLDAALVNKFEELAHELTGDDSIVYLPYTSEIQFECWGRTTPDHHCMSPKTPWKTGDDAIDWGELAHEAGEWIGENIESFLDQTA
jgi:hypothetical protein